MIPWDETVDIAIGGSGAAGLCAAIEARQRGASVKYTTGGLGINSKAQVIDLRGRPIPRLFAAGEVCGGIHGASRLGGCALPECIIFGLIAGQEAAETVTGNQG